MKTQDTLGSKLVQNRALPGRSGSGSLREASLLGAGALSLKAASTTVTGRGILARPLRRRQMTLELNRLNRFAF